MKLNTLKEAQETLKKEGYVPEYFYPVPEKDLYNKKLWELLQGGKMKPVNRKCENCGKIKKTTNLERKYLCEKCLKETGRYYFNNKNKGNVFCWIIVIVIFLIGVGLGYLL